MNVYEPTTMGGLERELERKRTDYKRMCGANEVIRDFVFYDERAEGLVKLGFSDSAVSKILERVRGNGPYFSNAVLVKVSEEIARLERELGELNSLIQVEMVEGKLRVAFPSRPSVRVVNGLKARQFRWSPEMGAWMGVNTADNRAFADELKG